MVPIFRGQLLLGRLSPVERVSNTYHIIQTLAEFWDHGIIGYIDFAKRMHPRNVEEFGYETRSDLLTPHLQYVCICS
jgi:hypothetical protein